MVAWHEKTLYQRVVQLWDDKDNVYNRLRTARENICDFFRPDLGVDYDEAADMLMLGGSIYEGSGPWVARTASTAFQGNSVSRKLDWLKYGYSDERLTGIDELDNHAQNMTKHISNVLQNGNFYDIQPQFTLDAWTIGSPLFFIEEDPATGRIMCIPSHWLSYRIFYDRFNKSEGVILKEKEWTAKNCFDKFVPPGSGQTLQQRLKKAEEIFSTGLWAAIRDGAMNERFTIWRAVFKSTNPVWGDDFKRPLGDKDWYDVYFEDVQINTPADETKPLLTGGYFSKPFVHWDFDKKVWESASRTPAFAAIYDTLSMQQIFKSYLDNLQIKVKPPVAALLAMKGRLDLSAEGITYVNQNEWQYLPKPMEQVGDIRLDSETMEKFEEKLGRWFHIPTFMMFSNLSKEAKQEFRVLQLAEMAGERITLLLPMMESHESFLEQVDRRVRDIERQRGYGPFNKQNIENIIDIIEWAIGSDPRAAEIKPEFIGTLRQAQQRQQKLSPLMQGVAALRDTADAMGKPELVQLMIKNYETSDEILRATNFPSKLITEKDDFDQADQALQESRARDKQFAQLNELMKNSKGIQGEVAPNSIMAQLTGSTAA